MKILIILCFASFSVVLSRTPYKGNCGVYEKFKHCPVSHCPPSCECIDGYTRNKYGDCRKDQTSQNHSSCGINESYDTCGKFDQETCDEPYKPVQPLICVRGCFCNAGHVRNSNNVCVPLESC